MKGSNLAGQAGNYGIQGIPNMANTPGGRHELSSTWTDDTGDLWLFGGFVFTQNYNDLWKYSITSNQWTWMKGANTINQIGNYGIQGIEDSTNTPGARMAYTHWKDKTGKFWLFGGGDFNNYYNDLWRYNPTTNNWAWIGGSNTINGTGTYGTKCDTSLNNIPGGRFENRSVWTDQAGNFWFFGGAKHANLNQVWNTLWMYCFTTSQWIWISGDNIINPTAYYGTPGVSSPVNKPSGRGGAAGWYDNNNHFYLFGGFFGGFNSGQNNDLWKYTVDTTCGVCPTSTGIQENKLTNELLVFPNPTNSSLTISFQSSEKQTVELRIYNTLGKQIYFSPKESIRTKEETTKGKFEKEINVEKWSEGIYFLQVKTSEGNISRKVIVNHP